MPKIVYMSFHRHMQILVNDPELADKMLFIAGPRQSGKTFLAKKWLSEKKCSENYYNWDDEKIRRLFRKDPHFFESAARQSRKRARIVFDEIHKIYLWKNILKGYYDIFSDDFDFMVTGSARLDLFQRSGDSLLGRYHLLHLYPLTPAEACSRESKSQAKNRGVSSIVVEGRIPETKDLKDLLGKDPYPQDLIESLIAYSGFPDPFQKASMRALNLWHREYHARVLREDMRDLSKIADLGRAEHCFELLKTRTSSPLSLNSLREDLRCSHDAVRAIIAAFERLALVILVRPYYKKIKYSLTREPKLYFYDWSLVADEGARYQGFMAIQLKAWCDYMCESGRAEAELFYIRDKQKREVDFLMVINGQPWMLVEAKLSQDKSAMSTLAYFSRILGVKMAFQVTREKDIWSRIDDGQWSVSAQRFFNVLWTA